MSGKLTWSPLRQTSEQSNKRPENNGVGARLTPAQEADLMHEVMALSPFFEKFAVNSVALVERRVAELKERVLHLDAEVFYKLTDRYGTGEEWRALADAHLLAVLACMDRLEMRLEWG